MQEVQPRVKPPNYLEINFEKHPDKTVFLGVGRSLTWGQLRERARALAKSIYHLGVKPGDQITTPED